MSQGLRAVCLTDSWARRMTPDKTAAVKGIERGKVYVKLKAYVFKHINIHIYMYVYTYVCMY
jgi:hypothetical protein